MQNNTDNRIKLKNTSGGFTLIEVLISVVIFAASITVLMTVIGKGIADTSLVRNKMVANYLAEEGIELVRYYRDYQTLSSGANGWLAGFYGPISSCQVATPCGVSILHASESPKPCQVSNGTCAITVSSITGVYSYIENPIDSNATPTIFTRQIYIDPTSGQDFITINSLITWKQGISTHSTHMSETLYNL